MSLFIERSFLETNGGNVIVSLIANANPDPDEIPYSQWPLIPSTNSFFPNTLFWEFGKYWLPHQTLFLTVDTHALFCWLQLGDLINQIVDSPIPTVIHGVTSNTAFQTSFMKRPDSIRDDWCGGATAANLNVKAEGLSIHIYIDYQNNYDGIAGKSKGYSVQVTDGTQSFCSRTSPLDAMLVHELFHATKYGYGWQQCVLKPDPAILALNPFACEDELRREIGSREEEEYRAVFFENQYRYLRRGSKLLGPYSADPRTDYLDRTGWVTCEKKGKIVPPGGGVLDGGVSGYAFRGFAPPPLHASRGVPASPKVTERSASSGGGQGSISLERRPSNRQPVVEKVGPALHTLALTSEGQRLPKTGPASRDPGAVGERGISGPSLFRDESAVRELAPLGGQAATFGDLVNDERDATGPAPATRVLPQLQRPQPGRQRWQRVAGRPLGQLAHAQSAIRQLDSLGRRSAGPGEALPQRDRLPVPFDNGIGTGVSFPIPSAGPKDAADFIGWDLSDLANGPSGTQLPGIVTPSVPDDDLGSLPFPTPWRQDKGFRRLNPLGEESEDAKLQRLIDKASVVIPKEGDELGQLVSGATLLPAPAAGADRPDLTPATPKGSDGTPPPDRSAGAPEHDVNADDMTNTRSMSVDPKELWEKGKQLKRKLKEPSPEGPEPGGPDDRPGVTPTRRGTVGIPRPGGPHVDQGDDPFGRPDTPGLRRGKIHVPPAGGPTTAPVDPFDRPDTPGVRFKNVRLKDGGRGTPTWEDSDHFKRPR